MGCPESGIDEAVSRLVAAGYKVCTCRNGPRALSAHEHGLMVSAHGQRLMVYSRPCVINLAGVSRSEHSMHACTIAFLFSAVSTQCIHCFQEQPEDPLLCSLRCAFRGSEGALPSAKHIIC